MTTATLGTCNSCGLGLNLPHRAPWHPGQRVVVLTEAEYEALVNKPPVFYPPPPTGPLIALTTEPPRRYIDDITIEKLPFVSLINRLGSSSPPVPPP